MKKVKEFLEDKDNRNRVMAPMTLYLQHYGLKSKSTKKGDVIAAITEDINGEYSQEL